MDNDTCSPLELPYNEKRTVSLQVQTVTEFKPVTNVVGYLRGWTSPDRYVIVGNNHHAGYGYNGQEWASSTAVITAFIQALMLRVKKGWRPERTIVFCSWGGTTWGNIGSYEWGEDHAKVLQKNAVAYISLHSPIRGNSSLHPVASPSLQQLVLETIKFNCTRKSQCPGANVSSVQIQGDADYFINHLGVPAVQYTYEDIKTLEWSLLHRDISLETKVKPNQQINCRRADWGSFDCTIYEMAVTQGVILKLLCASKSLRSKHKKLKYETDVEKKIKQRVEKH
ncbi:hypothetical protein ACRRTK_010199 [Alexandromys fortis]